MEYVPILSSQIKNYKMVVEGLSNLLKYKDEEIELLKRK